MTDMIEVDVSTPRVGKITEFRVSTGKVVEFSLMTNQAFFIGKFGEANVIIVVLPVTGGTGQALMLLLPFRV